jgi:cytidine deaminase
VGSKKIHIDPQFTEFDSFTDLPADVQKLVKTAKEVSTSAYAPYSKFMVGSAVLLENGVVVTGCNQENSAYPSGLCAERVALFSAHANYPGIKVKVITIFGTHLEKEALEPIAPCGACRQVISEYEDLANQKIDIYMAADKKVIHAKGIESLLPFRFRLL